MIEIDEELNRLAGTLRQPSAQPSPQPEPTLPSYAQARTGALQGREDAAAAVSLATTSLLGRPATTALSGTLGGGGPTGGGGGGGGGGTTINQTITLSTSVLKRIRDSLTAPNLLPDPTFEHCVGAVLPDGTNKLVSAVGSLPAWWVKRTVGSGTWQVTGGVGTDARDSPIGMSIGWGNSLWIVGPTSAATTQEIMLWSQEFDIDQSLAYTVQESKYLQGAIHLMRRTAVNPTVENLIVELYDVTAAAVVKTQTCDLKTIAPVNVRRRFMLFGFQPTTAQKSHAWQLRARFIVSGTDAAQPPIYHVYHPTAYFTSVPTLQLVSPWLGRWEAPRLFARGAFATEYAAETYVASETDPRYTVGMDGELIWWNAGTEATRVRRVTGGTLPRLDLDDGAAGNVALRHRGYLLPLQNQDIAVTYDGANRPVTAALQYGATSISSTTISYSGAHLASVVTTKDGKTITVTPTYTGDNITAIARVVT